jgi:hypothetical protein
MQKRFLFLKSPILHSTKCLVQPTGTLQPSFKRSAYLSFGTVATSPVRLSLVFVLPALRATPPSLPRLRHYRMPGLYANYYMMVPEMPERTLEAIYTTLAQVHPPLWLLNTLSRLSEPYVMAYIDPDGEIHVIHQVCHHEASLVYPAPCYAGLYIGLVDESSEFGSSLAAIDEDFVGELQVDNVPSAAAVTAALANWDEPQMQVATDDDTGLVQMRYCILVLPLFVPDLLRMLAPGSVWPRDLWPMALHILACPTVLEACGQFVDWCRVTIAMGEGADNPLQGLDGDPVPVTVDECLGCAHLVVRHLDFPTLPAAPTAPTAAPTLLQPLVDALVAFGHANCDSDDAKEARCSMEAEDKVSPARIWETGIDSLLRLCQVPDMTLLPPVWAQLAKAGIKHGHRADAVFWMPPLMSLQPLTPSHSQQSDGRSSAPSWHARS